MRLQTLQIEADPGSRERSQRAQLGEPPPPATAAASFRCPGPAAARPRPQPPRRAHTGRRRGQAWEPHLRSPQCARAPHVTRPGSRECVPRISSPGPPPSAPNHRSPARPSGMAAAKAEMQLMSPLQISDPFGSFPHSPAMDNYPKLEEMMMLSNGAPQFLGAAGAPEGSGGNSSSSSGGGGGGGGGGSSNSSSGGAFNPQGEAGEQPYEHLTSGKRWPTPRMSPFATTPAPSPSPTASAGPQGCKWGFPSIPRVPESGVRGKPGDIRPHPHPHPPHPQRCAEERASFCFGPRALGLRGWGRLVLISRAAGPLPLHKSLPCLPPVPQEGL